MVFIKKKKKPSSLRSLHEMSRVAFILSLNATFFCWKYLKSLSPFYGWVQWTVVFPETHDNFYL